VSKGQKKGYLSAYSAATLFKGVYTDCDEGERSSRARYLLLKKVGFAYSIADTRI